MRNYCLLELNSLGRTTTTTHERAALPDAALYRARRYRPHLQNVPHRWICRVRDAAAARLPSNARGNLCDRIYGTSSTGNFGIK